MVWCQWYLIAAFGSFDIYVFFLSWQFIETGWHWVLGSYWYYDIILNCLICCLDFVIYCLMSCVHRSVSFESHPVALVCGVWWCTYCVVEGVTLIILLKENLTLSLLTVKQCKCARADMVFRVFICKVFTVIIKLMNN